MRIGARKMKVWAVCLELCLVSVTVVSGAPLDSDSQVVQSLVREVRAAPDHLEQLVNPDTEKAFLHKYSDTDGDDDESGYEKKFQDDGAKGYKHYDSYHKKGGDKYGYATKSAYGKLKSVDEEVESKANKYQDHHDDGNSSQKGRKSAKSRSNDDGEEQQQKEEQQEEDGDGEQETRSTYKVVEDVEEDDDGHSGSYTNYGDDEEDSGQYNEEDDGGSAGHYTEEGAALEEYDDDEDDGSSAHYTADGSSGNTYDDDEQESEHYTAADHDDYDY